MLRIILAAVVSCNLATAAAGAPSRTAAGPFSPVLQWTTDDLNAAIKIANAATPPDTDGVTCFQSLLATVQLVQANGGLVHWPPTLIADYEKAWLIHAQLAALKASSACAVVCGRAATMLAVYGGTVNNFCIALAKLP